VCVCVCVCVLKVMNDDEFDVITYSLIGPHARLYVLYTRPASIYLSLCLSLSMSVSVRNVPTTPGLLPHQFCVVMET